MLEACLLGLTAKPVYPPVHKPSNAEEKTLMSGSAYCFILWSTLYDIIFPINDAQNTCNNDQNVC